MIALALAIAASVCGPVELRGGDVVTAPIEAVSIEGVRIGGAEPRVIAWDSVRKVIGDRASAAAEFERISEDAWRARLRLARGDHALAAPIFERLWVIYSEKSGPTALMIAEGTLACRLASGRSADAIEPWLHAVALREQGVVIAGDPPLTPVVDNATMLVPSLAPVWLDGAAARVEIDAAHLPRIGVAGELATLFAISARSQAGDTNTGALPSRDHPGVGLVRLIAECVASDAARREAARFAMEQRLSEDAGSWREAWIRAAIGRSFLMEQAPRDRMVGVFHLMHLPARFAWSHPELAMMALALASRELAAQGDAAGAAAIRAELERVFPGARAVDWLDAQADPVELPTMQPKLEIDVEPRAVQDTPIREQGS